MTRKGGILTIGPTGIDVSVDLNNLRQGYPAAAVRLSLGGVCRNCSIDLARLGANVGFLTQNYGNVQVGHPGLPNEVEELWLAPDSNPRPWLALFAALVEGANVRLSAAAYEEAALLFTIEAAEREEPRIRSYQTIITSSDVSYGFWDVVRRGPDADQQTKCLLTSGLPLPENYLDWLRNCDLFFINADEARQLGYEPEPFCHEALRHGARTVFVTTSEDAGAWYGTRDRTPRFRNARALEQRVMSSVGAGDGFAAGVVRALTMGMGVAECVDIGLATAGLVLLETSHTLSESINVRDLLRRSAFHAGIKP